MGDDYGCLTSITTWTCKQKEQNIKKWNTSITKIHRLIISLITNTHTQTIHEGLIYYEMMKNPFTSA